MDYEQLQAFLLFLNLNYVSSSGTHIKRSLTLSMCLRVIESKKKKVESGHWQLEMVSWWVTGIISLSPGSKGERSHWSPWETDWFDLILTFISVYNFFVIKIMIFKQIFTSEHMPNQHHLTISWLEDTLLHCTVWTGIQLGQPAGVTAPYSIPLPTPITKIRQLNVI